MLGFLGCNLACCYFSEEGFYAAYFVFQIVLEVGWGSHVGGLVWLVWPALRSLLGGSLGLVGSSWDLVIAEAVSRVQDWVLGLPEVFCWKLDTSGLLQVASLVLGKLLPAWSFLLVLVPLAMWLAWSGSKMTSTLEPGDSLAVSRF